MGAVEIAADEDRFAGGELLQMTAEVGIPLEPVVETEQLALGIGHVGADHEAAGKFGGNDAPLVGVRAVNVGGDGERRDATEDGGAGVARLVGGVKKLMRVGNRQVAALGDGSLGFLQAKDVGRMRVEKRVKRLGGDGANAVNVPRIETEPVEHRVINVRRDAAEWRLVGWERGGCRRRCRLWGREVGWAGF